MTGIQDAETCKTLRSEKLGYNVTEKKMERVARAVKGIGREESVKKG